MESKAYGGGMSYQPYDAPAPYSQQTSYAQLYENHPAHSSGPYTSVTAMDQAVSVPQTLDYSLEDPPADLHKTHRMRKYAFWLFRYVLIVVLVGVALLIPVIVYRNQAYQLDNDVDSIYAKRYANLVFYIFLWLLLAWTCGVIWDIVALTLPYAFRLVARYVNPAHQRYWRVFRALRLPLVIWGFTICSLIIYTALIPFNPALTVHYTDKTGEEDETWDEVLGAIHYIAALWTSAYLALRVLVLYIIIHHHYRSNFKRIGESKQMQKALIALYEASLYLHPVGSPSFEREDLLIRNAKGLEGGSARKRVTTYLSKMGVDSYGMTSFFGNFLSDDPASHWLKPASSYAAVERAVASPKSAAALARRIWLSLVARGSTALTETDVAEVLGPHRADESRDIFKTLDVNEAGDLRLDELVWTVVEAGNVRHNIYQGMHDVDHCISTFSGVAFALLALVMVLITGVLYLPLIKEIQTTLSAGALGLSFAIGRTVHHFLVGVIYVFFDHPFDVGDRVEIYNMAATNNVSAIVTRQSLLYTCFRRVDNGMELQIQNERLANKRIENHTRSGLNRQALSLIIDIRTPFKDIMQLKTELTDFLSEPDNRRDYQPDLALSIVSLHELNKMELRLNFGHKSNWSNERLRATRSNRFMAALLATVRRVPIYRPGFMTGCMGDADKPIYHAWVTDAEARANNAVGNADRAAKRWDAPPPPPSAPSDSTAAETEQQEDPEAREAAMKKAAKAAADAASEEGAFTRMTKIPTLAPEFNIKDSGSSSAVEVEQMITQGATGLRATSNAASRM